MRSARAAAPGWDITVPSLPRLPAGLTMAGFSDRANVLGEIDLVPHPAVTVVLDLTDQPFRVDDGRGGEVGNRLVAGLAPRGLRARGFGGTFECLQLRLSPALAHAVFGALPGGDVLALDDLWGHDAARLHDRLRATGSWDERFAIAGTAITERLGDGRRLDPEVAYCWDRLAAGRGRVRVEPLAAGVGWSRKRLWTRFRAQVGLGPKRAAQLLRFDHAAHRLAAGNRVASVAAEAGYADQSHLHRDVASFIGATPTAMATAPFLAVDDVAWPR